MADDTQGPRLPADVTDIAVLRQMLAVPPLIHTSVAVRLAERGKLFAFRNCARPTLAGHADYLVVLSEFCDTVQGFATALADSRAIQPADAMELERQKGKRP